MREIRYAIFCVTFILLMFGVVMVYSSSAIYAGQTYNDSFFFLKRHVIFLLIGFILSLGVMTVNIDTLRDNAIKILGLSIFLLIIVLIPGIGHQAGGARRWLQIGFLNIQPSEIAKIAVVIYLASFIERRETRIGNLLKGFIPPLLVIGGLMALVVVEPDLGTTVTIGVIGMLMLFMAGANVKHILSTLLLGFPFLLYLVMKVPYRRQRILAFLDPWVDERGSGFQIVQSFIAFGSGGLMGVGLGQSKQKLFFLPASHTDFIFSIVGEELGFIGASCIVGLFFIFLWQGIKAAFKIEDTFRKYLVFGIVLIFAFEVLVNVGVSSGLFPTKGLPLPFISYGGTSLVMHMIAVALLLNATRE